MNPVSWNTADPGYAWIFHYCAWFPIPKKKLGSVYLLNPNNHRALHRRFLGLSFGGYQRCKGYTMSMCITSWTSPFQERICKFPTGCSCYPKIIEESTRGSYKVLSKLKMQILLPLLPCQAKHKKNIQWSAKSNQESYSKLTARAVFSASFVFGCELTQVKLNKLKPKPSKWGCGTCQSKMWRHVDGKTTHNVPSQARSGSGKTGIAMDPQPRKAHMRNSVSVSEF